MRPWTELSQFLWVCYILIHVPPCFITICTKGNIFSALLFASLGDKPFPKRYARKEKNLLFEEPILFFKTDLHREGMKKNKDKQDPEVIKLFSCSNQLSMKF